MQVKENFVTGAMFADYVDWRAEHPSDDIMTELLNVEFTDETDTVRKLTRNELLTYLEVLAGAGNETTTRLIGWTAKVLADHPDQRAELVADPSLIPNAIEEILRYESPAPHVGRCVAKQDLVVHGTEVPAGQRDALPPGLGQPGRPPLPQRRQLRHPPQRRPASHLRQRHPPVHGRRAGPHGRGHRARRGADPYSPTGTSTWTTPGSPPPRPCGAGRRSRCSRSSRTAHAVDDGRGRTDRGRDRQARSARRRHAGTPAVRQHLAAPAGRRDPGAHHRRRLRAPARLVGAGLARADHPGRGREGRASTNAPSTATSSTSRACTTR